MEQMKDTDKKPNESEIILKRDIVIPAGTVFSRAPVKTERYGDGHYMVDIAMNDDSTASFCVDITDCVEFF